jgi:hypothetical protein
VADLHYASVTAPIRNAYCGSLQLVVQPGASLPDVCIVCGSATCGNVLQKSFPKISWWFLLPSVLDFVVYLIAGMYLFDFPLCSNCPPKRVRLIPTRLDHHLAVFYGASNRFLASLPPIPADVATEMNRSWLQRTFRWMYP